MDATAGNGRAAEGATADAATEAGVSAAKAGPTHPGQLGVPRGCPELHAAALTAKPRSPAAAART